MPIITAVLSTLALLRPPAHISLSPCTLPGVSAPASCGTITVIENRAAGSGRSIRLRVAVIPAIESPRAPDAVTYFDGGPGGAAVADAGFVFHMLGPLHRRHDIFLVDQRGTGQSSPLTCRPFGSADSVQQWLGSFLPLDAITRCVAELTPNADLTVYTTNNHVDDIDDVRAALGYEMIDVTGISYGSRASLTYLKRHGAHVRAMVIEGIAPTSDFVPETFARDAQGALDGVFAECAAEAACHAAFPDLSSEIRRVIAQLEQQPARVRIAHPVTGDTVTVTLNRDLFAEALRYMMYSAGGASWVPAVVHAAASGDFAPAAERAALYRYRLVGSGDTGLYLAVTCDEDLPFVDVARGTELGRNTFLGNYRLHDQSAACQIWPHVAADPEFKEPTRSDVPTLLFSGERDPVTPPSNGELAARTLTHSRHIVVKSGGHGYNGLAGVQCVDSILQRFLERPDLATLDTQCLAAIHRPPFPTTLAWSQPIVLDTLALRRFVGRFAGDSEPRSATTSLEHGKLHMTAQGQGSVVLVPVSPTRFWIVGTAGNTVSFRMAPGHATELVVEVDGRAISMLRAESSGS